jgi:hypothetical protein
MIALSHIPAAHKPTQVGLVGLYPRRPRAMGLQSNPRTLAGPRVR